MAVSDRWHVKPRQDAPPAEVCAEHKLVPSARHGEGRRWLVRYRGHPSRSFASKGAAERYWLKCRTEAPRQASEVTVGELLDRWLAGKAGLSKSRQDGTRAAASRVRKRWADVPVSDVTEQDVREWQAGLKGPGCGPSSIRKAMEALSGCMRLAIKMHAISENPCVEVSRPAEPVRDARFLTPAELEALADAAGGYRPMVLLMGTTGLRIGEACNLRVGDVDRRRRRLWVASKTAKSRKGREVGIPSGVLQLLPLKGRNRTEFVFTTSSGGRLDEHNWRERVFKPAVEKAQLGKVTPHDCRHTAVSLAIRSGADVKVVQRVAGHASAKLTLDRYGHLWDQGIDDVARRMDELIGSDPEPDPVG